VSAPEHTVLVAGATVPVALRMRNVCAAGPVAFYYTTEGAPEFEWLGCERSAVITLEPFAWHTETLPVRFTSPGVFNLNRVRLFVVAAPTSASAVPASEQAPLVFQFPFERLINVEMAAE